MTVYNINLGIGWASSGVEYAQAYRAHAFRDADIAAKFVFSDLILGNNIADLTSNLGFNNDQIIWLYNFFTDVKISSSTVLLKDFVAKANLEQRGFVCQDDNGSKEVYFTCQSENLTIVPRYNDQSKKTIDQVSYLFNNRLIKREFYSYVKYATEYYTGAKDNNRVVFREFYNEDGTCAYVQHVGKNGNETFEFSDCYYYSKTELYQAMLKKLNFQSNDVIILDRMDEDKQLVNGPLVFAYHKPAKLIVAVHADHYDKHYTNDHQVLWNNFYEYQFTHYRDVDCYVVATKKQQDLLTKQFRHFYNATPKIVAIPVGSIHQLVNPIEKRKPCSMITASRLAKEKHVDWIIKASTIAKKRIPDLTLDIYGEGGERGRLQELIKKAEAQSYIRLMGQRNLANVYQKYETYIAGSTSEGFGLSLLEAVGSGLSMIGFDVPYGNQTFIEEQKNGYLLPYEEDWDTHKKESLLATAIINTFTQPSLKKFHQYSYKIAKSYLTTEVAEKWQRLLGELHNA